jgi:Gluconate 2-dehydrogenase subunit 3
MGNEKNLVVIESATTERSRLTRRTAVQRLLSGMTAGAAWPLAASSHPIFELLRSDALLRNDAIFDRAEQLGQANWKPAFLSPQQDELLMALAESIVPDSTRAHVNRFIDLLLSVDKPEYQRTFAESLAAIEAEVQKRFKKSFPALNEEQKNSFLTDASAKPKDVEAPESEAVNSALHVHFENLKGWISSAFYSSEVGMRELGWTSDYAFAAFPGCAHPEGHHGGQIHEQNDAFNNRTQRISSRRGRN